GLPLAVAALFLAEPARGGADPHFAAESHPPPFLTAVRRVLRLPTMWWVIASGALHNFNMYALGSFLASLLKRYHGVSVERAGQVSGLVYGCGAVGIFVAGWLGGRGYRRGGGGRVDVGRLSLGLAAPRLLVALAAPR